MALRRLRAIRCAILAGGLLASLGVVGAILAVTGVAPPLAAFAILPVWVFPIVFAWSWVMADSETTAARGLVRAGMTSDDIARNMNARGIVVIDDDPEWGKLAEGHEQRSWTPLTAVQVTNATPEPDGTYKKYWLRVPARGDRQPERRCAVCKADIGFPPRKAKEAIAWTFGLCSDHYSPAAAS